MYDTDRFLYHLKEDTKISAIQWQSINESYSDDYCSIDFRSTNPPLKKWIFDNPFYNWQDIYFAEIMEGFVFLAKTKGVPPSYSLYVQPDVDSKICRLGLKSPVLKELYCLIEEQKAVSYDKVSLFIEYYNNLPVHLDEETDESYSE